MSRDEELWEAEMAAALQTCARGHRSSLAVRTAEGGSICLACLSALVSDPCAPSHHVSYAVSQLSLALRSPPFLASLRTCHHAHLLVPPLVSALANSPDDSLARQASDLITDLCRTLDADEDPDRDDAASSSFSLSVSAHFTARIADVLSSRPLSWSRCHIHMIHCLGILLDSHLRDNQTIHIASRAPLFSNLIMGLQLPSEEIRGEILFVLYKLAVLQDAPWDDDGDEEDSSHLSITIGRLLQLSLEILLKTQHDDVRINCIALLTVVARRGFLDNLFANERRSSDSREAHNLMQEDEAMLHFPTLHLFTDAVKGSLLSSDIQVQINTLDLIFHTLSSDMVRVKQVQALVEDDIADYVFEILRMSGNKDPLVISCLQVLDLLAMAEAFKHRLSIAFPILLPVLRYVAEIPLHPAQSQVLKLVWIGISNYPGTLTMPHVEEIMLVLTEIFQGHYNGEIGMLPETFTLACSTFAEILRSPCVRHIQKLTPIIQQASKYTVLSSLTAPCGHSNPLMLYSLYILKEAHMFSCERSFNTNPEHKDLETSILRLCETSLLPWFERIVGEGQDEEVLLGVLELFHVILLGGTELQTRQFAGTLASSSWFSLSFECLGLFPSDQMRSRVYLMLSTVIDRVFGPDFGKPIRDIYLHLPLDPHELINLLGLSSSNDSILASCQSAVLLLLYTSSLFGERLADEHQVLASLEQYILLNNCNFSCGIFNSLMLTQLVVIYGLVRSILLRYGTPYSQEAEKTLFHLIIQKEWDLVSIGINSMVLGWLFQQEGILPFLSNQMLEFCRIYSTIEIQINVCANKIEIMDIQMVADLVIAGDNYVTPLLVSLLKQANEEGRQDDTISVLNVIATILNIFPGASNEFCSHGVSNALQSVYYSIHTSKEIFMTTSLLVFNLLYMTNPKMLSHDGDWLAVTMKLLDFLNSKLVSVTCGDEGYLVLSILSLILHHSTMQALVEASRIILLNGRLVSALNNIVQTACAKGPSSDGDDKESSIGKSLLFVLMVYFFSLRSLKAVSEEVIDWQNFLQTSNEVQPLPVICIKCHDICRLIHFGSTLVKIVASQCLVELLTNISDQINKTHYDLKCSARYLETIIAVVEGLLFYGDNIVATNCAICLSIILGLEKLVPKEGRVISDSKWCRLAMEELTLILAAPGLASKSLMNQHKPAAHVAVALLRLQKVPEWISSVFSNSCISGIIANLSATNVSHVVVKLFRELMSKKFLSEEHVADLHHLFQICRKHVYKDSEKLKVEHFRNGLVAADDTGKLCSLLFHLMLFPCRDSCEMEADHKELLEEIELFFLESST